ncbi:MAG: IS3 family transposase [Desulfobulbaceae bacterium]|nr:IS3 family transposase [Desulfobulbaceae bacterium]
MAAGSISRWSWNSSIGRSTAIPSARALLPTTTVIPALEMAVLQQQPPEGVIFHSDRGVQYASRLFRAKLAEHKMIQSMSGKRNCIDNAVTESFFKTMKSDWIYGKRFRNLDELQKSLFEYVQIFYNRKRLHSSLGHLAPAEYLRNYYQPKVLAS